MKAAKERAEWSSKSGEERDGRETERKGERASNAETRGGSRWRGGVTTGDGEDGEVSADLGSFGRGGTAREQGAFLLLCDSCGGACHRCGYQRIVHWAVCPLYHFSGVLWQDVGSLWPRHGCLRSVGCVVIQRRVIQVWSCCEIFFFS